MLKMATVAVGKASFTYIWIVENYSELTYIDLKSPVFIAHAVSKEEWYLEIAENFDVRCSLRSEDAPREEIFALNMEISLLAADGSTLISKRSDKYLNTTIFSRSEFLSRLAELIPNNTLTIQCRLWRKASEIPIADLCHARTRLKTYTGSFLWPIKEFSALLSSAAEDFRELGPEKRKVCSLSPFTQKGPFVALILYLKQNSEFEDVHVDLLVEKGRNYAFSFELLVLDSNGKVIESHEERFRTYFAWTFVRFWPVVSKRKLFSNKNLFLPNDTLILRCNFEVCTGVVSSEIEYCTPHASPGVKEKEEVLDFYVEEADADDTLYFEKYFVKEYDDSNIDSVDEKMNSESCRKLCPLKAVLNYLYSEAILSDISLRIGLKLYPVHKNILYSRCPSFQTTFLKDSKENFTEINDMDEDTFDRLLQYIYTDTVGNLQLENALDLYKVAADYQFLDLKDKCSDCLIISLSKSNVRSLLLLATKYQDKKLEKAGRDFVSSSGKKFKIFKNFEKFDQCTLT